MHLPLAQDATSQAGEGAVEDMLLGVSWPAPGSPTCIDKSPNLFSRARSCFKELWKRGFRHCCNLALSLAIADSMQNGPPSYPKDPVWN
eukprot:6379571-Amphidinium_carterae.1